MKKLTAMINHTLLLHILFIENIIFRKWYGRNVPEEAVGKEYPFKEVSAAPKGTWKIQR